MTFQYDIVPESQCFACNDLVNFNIGIQDKLSKFYHLVWVFNVIIIDYSPFMSAWSFYSCSAYMIHEVNMIQIQ